MTQAINPIHGEVVAGLKRSVIALQHDTFDNLAHRYFGKQAPVYLPGLIELNANFAPVAIIPMGSVVVLPDTQGSSQNPTLKLWD